MKKIGLIVLFLGGQLARLSAQQPCNTFDCVFQKAEQILKTSTAKDKYEKVLANLDDAENFAGNDQVKKDKIKALRQQAFLAIKKEKERADQLAAASRRQFFTTYANDLAYKSQTALRDGYPTTAFQLATFAYQYVEAGNANVTRALVEALYYNDVPARPPLPWSMNLEGHTAFVMSVAFSPDGKRLATGSWDKSAKIWDLQSGKETLSLQGHTSYVTSIAFSPDGQRLATGSFDKTAKIWDLDSGKPTLNIEGHSSAVTSLAFSPDGQRLATGSWDKSAKIWDIQSGKETLSLRGHTAFVMSVAFSPDGKRLATGAIDKSAKIWDLQSGKETLSLEGHTDNVSSVAFSPDGKRLATGSSDNTAKIWDLQSGKETLSLEGHTDNVWSVAFSPDGQRLATGSYDKTAKIWDLDSSKQFLVLGGHINAVFSVVFSPDGKRLATGSYDKTAKIWDFTPEGWRSTTQGKSRQRTDLDAVQLAFYNLETLLDLHPDNEAKLIATREVWQIKAFADLAAKQVEGSKILSKVEAAYARANRLYAAALALQDEPLIRMDWAKMLRKWAAVYRDDGKEGKAKELEGKADGLWKEER